MTISKTAVYGSDRDQVLQDIYSNIDVLSRFVRDVKEKTVAGRIQFDKHHIDDREELIDVLVAENAVASITTLVSAEIQGGYKHKPLTVVDEDRNGARDEPKDTERPYGPGAVDWAKAIVGFRCMLSDIEESFTAGVELADEVMPRKPKRVPSRNDRKTPASGKARA